MSFVHSVMVGFFGEESERGPVRELEWGECCRLLARFKEIVPPEWDVVVCEAPWQHRGVQIVGKCGGRELVLRRGNLDCPWFSVAYHYPSIAFAIYVAHQVGCSICSEDGFVDAEQLLPNRTLASELREYLEGEYGDNWRACLAQMGIDIDVKP